MGKFLAFLFHVILSATYVYADPVYIRSFDLGGRGLKTALFSYNTESQTIEWIGSPVLLGKCPDELEVHNWLRYRLKKLVQTDLDEEIQTGYLFSFSLAGLDKIRNKPVSTFDMAILCDLPSDKVRSIDDGASHLIASLHSLTNGLPKGPIWNFSLGTGIGIGCTDANHKVCKPFDLYGLFGFDLWTSEDPTSGLPVWQACGSTYGFDGIVAKHGGLVDDSCFLEFALRWKSYLDSYIFNSILQPRIPKAIVFTGGHVEVYGSRFVNVLATLGIQVPLFIGPPGSGLLGAAWHAITYDPDEMRWLEAVICQDEKKLQFFLEKNIDINQCDALGYGALFLAIKAGELNWVKALITNGARIDMQIPFLGSSLLSFAAEKNDPAIVEYLLKNGADPKACDCWGRTPLFFAKKNGHRVIQELLIKYGATL